MQTRRILIVDDAPEFAHLVKDALATMQIPLQVTVYLSGEEAWLEALKTRFDLVITDLRLPGISGTELIRRVRQRFPKIKIIAVSGLAEAGLNERTRAAGVDAFYRKPVEIPLLLTKIDNLLSEIGQDDESYDRPTKAPMLSRLVTVPLNLKPEMTESTPEPVKKVNKPTPEDITSMRDLEQRLLKLMRESGAQGVALTTMTGQILYTHGSAVDFKFSPELINACANLVNAIKQMAKQPEDTTTLGLLALSGYTTDLSVAHIGKFFVWLMFPTGSQSSDAGKAAAAIYGSKDSLQFIMNMLAMLPAPIHPHPPVGKHEPHKESMAPKEDEELLMEKKIAEKQIDKKAANTFWDSESPDNSEVHTSPETISFDKAASMGLVKSEPPKKKD
jgi:CheY-like chemotaxis protein